MSDAATPPPGWYDDAATPGGHRWWDGTQWTSHTRPPLPAPMPPAPTPQSVATAPTAVLAAVEESGYLYVPGDDGDDRPRWRRKRVLLPAGVGVLLLAAVLTVDPDTSDLEATGAVPTLEPGSAEGNQFIGGQDEADTSTSATSDTTPTSDATSTTTSTAATSAPPTTVASSGVGEASSVSTAAAAVESSATAATPASSAAPTTVSATTVSATTVSATTVAAGTTAAPAPDCHPAYSPCIPNRAGDAINCGDLSAAQKPVTVLDPSYDPYRLDADGDGRGCEG